MTTLRTQSHIRGGVALSAALHGFALFGAANTSEAQPPGISVSYADLNLSQIKDAQTLYGRLRRASGTVCGSFDESSLPLQVEWHAATNRHWRKPS